MHRRALLPLALLPVLLPLGLAACDTGNRPLDVAEIALVRAGGHAVLLLRLVGTDQRGVTRQPLRMGFDTAPIGTGWGDFDSGGAPGPWFYRSPSDAAWEAGWVMMALPPGTYYLYIQPPIRIGLRDYNAQLSTTPRWRIEVPAHVPVVYGGTLSIAERSEAGIWSRLWVGVDFERSTVLDETAAAAAMAARDLVGLGPPHTRLMVPHSGPIRLGVPQD